MNGQKLPWTSGKVAMEGVSYNGTTANMVAAQGDKAPGLVGIVSVAAISRWYGYAFDSGMRYFLNSKDPQQQGFDTPLLFDGEYGRTFLQDTNNPYFQDLVKQRTEECGIVEHTMQGYSLQPNYGPFWQERDYLEPARQGKYRAAALIVHGWQDYNVKQAEGTRLYEALTVDDPKTTEIVEGVPFKRLYMSQAQHANGVDSAYLPLRDRFLYKVLLGQDNGVDRELPVMSRGTGSNGDAPATSYSREASWPPPGTADLTLHLGRSFTYPPGVPGVGPVGSTGETGTLELAPQNDGFGWVHTDPGWVTEEITMRDPLNRGFSQTDSLPTGHVQGLGYYSLYQESGPLKAPMRIAGSARLDAWVDPTHGEQALTPVLVDVAPDGTMKLVERGFLNLAYRDGLAVAKPSMGVQHAVVTMLPQDYTFAAGHRIGLLLQSSNTVWARPNAVGEMVYAMGPAAQGVPIGTRLHLPVVGLGEPTALLTK